MSHAHENRNKAKKQPKGDRVQSPFGEDWMRHVVALAVPIDTVLALPHFENKKNWTFIWFGSESKPAAAAASILAAVPRDQVNYGSFPCVRIWSETAITAAERAGRLEPLLADPKVARTEDTFHVLYVDKTALAPQRATELLQPFTSDTSAAISSTKDFMPLSAGFMNALVNTFNQLLAVERRTQRTRQ